MCLQPAARIRSRQIAILDLNVRRARGLRARHFGVVGAIYRLPDAELMPESAKAREAGVARFRSMFDALLADPAATLPG